MEKSLQDRDRVGVQDCVLLENFTSIDVFVDNLRKRHREDLIYTSIGHVLISVNPYKPLPIYTDDVIREYRRQNFVDTAPHVFAVADRAYRSLTEENRGQCILISGESGAGKTEASKKVLQFVAAATGHVGQVEAVKDKLLLSNPVLEAFGNAKTNKNDNSSRFGKYMDIAFDYKGDPAGGNILNYLLEKSRVVYQSPGERNFHIFYQLLAGADQKLLDSLELVRERGSYRYLKHSSTANAFIHHVSNSNNADNDAMQFHEVCRALDAMELSPEEQGDMFRIVASIMHLGNVQFVEEEGIASIPDRTNIDRISKLLGCDSEDLATALTHRSIEARGEVVTSPHNHDLAVYAKHALAKAVYDRLFTWLVERLNSSLQAPKTDTSVIGILDIYGFEVFQKNGYEQFCINLCNEKLQQLFINLTLKQEQDEYRREGIEWVQVEFFDNKVICEMIEQKHTGIISMMNEECLRPGEPTDSSLLVKMNENLSAHPHYFSHERSDIKTQKTMGRDEFRLVHYAGEVTYSVEGFLDKNSDLLFRDLCEVMTKTKNSIVKSVFKAEELNRKKRPDTAMSKFQRSLNELMVILSNKEPSYIRCIRPNDNKSAGIFDDAIVKHQVKYLGLMENLRVRRAGFAYRRPYEDFLHRYKCLSKNTWPNYKGPTKEGVQVLVKDLGYTEEEYKMGTTKLFIRSPTTLFKTEDAFQLKKNAIATTIQKVWRGRRQRQRYMKIRKAAISMERIVRGFLARKAAERRRNAVATVRRFIIGFITRNGPETDINKKFVRQAKVLWLLRLATQLPKGVLNRYWPPCPNVCKEASEQIHELHRRHLARRYCLALPPQRKRALEVKILAESLFKGKKKSYAQGFPKWFESNRLLPEHRDFVDSFTKANLNGEKILYSISVTKYDRHGYKPRPRILLLSDKNVYLLDNKSGKQKHRLTHQSVTELVVTAGGDPLLLVRITPDLKKEKGDLILSVPHLIETVTTFIDVTKMPQVLKIVPTGEIPHNVINGRPGTIQVAAAQNPTMTKGKGTLIVEG